METVVSWDGTRIAYERSGTGPPLLLVHGSLADHTRWGPILPMLEPHFTVYAMDARGRGGSGDAEEYAIERDYEDVAAVVDAIGRPVDVVGHSHGALTGLEAALLTPNIGRLVLYEPPEPGVRIVPAETTARMKALLEAGDRAGVIRTLMLEGLGATEEEFEMVRAAPSWPSRLAAAHTVLREDEAEEALPPFDPARFTGLTIPVLLLLGGDSPPLLSNFTARLHAALPNSKVVILPGQQHIAITTAPDLFAREVLAFLAAPDEGFGGG
jgi:pimeloyl-ACP methyl ester carboxylesterase